MQWLLVHEVSRLFYVCMDMACEILVWFLWLRMMMHVMMVMQQDLIKYKVSNIIFYAIQQCQVRVFGGV